MDLSNLTEEQKKDLAWRCDEVAKIYAVAAVRLAAMMKAEALIQQQTEAALDEESKAASILFIPVRTKAHDQDVNPACSQENSQQGKKMYESHGYKWRLLTPRKLLLYENPL